MEMLFCSLILFSLSLGFFFNFYKKLIAVLILEGMMIVLIFYLTISSSMLYNLVFIMLLSILLVLESVMSISLFVSSIRNSSLISHFFF